MKIKFTLTLVLGLAILFGSAQESKLSDKAAYKVVLPDWWEEALETDEAVGISDPVIEDSAEAVQQAIDRALFWKGLRSGARMSMVSDYHNAFTESNFSDRNKEDFYEFGLIQGQCKYGFAELLESKRLSNGEWLVKVRLNEEPQEEKRDFKMTFFNKSLQARNRRVVSTRLDIDTYRPPETIRVVDGKWSVDNGEQLMASTRTNYYNRQGDLLFSLNYGLCADLQRRMMNQLILQMYFPGSMRIKTVEERFRDRNQRIVRQVGSREVKLNWERLRK